MAIAPHTTAQMPKPIASQEITGEMMGQRDEVQLA
jgi:hypothetical protein